jgi:anti-anti-sigma regulatory factor
VTRQHGVVASAAGLPPFGHLGWGFGDRAEFLARAAEYLADGLRYNHFVAYVGEGTRDELRAELAAMPAIGERFGDIEVNSIKDHYVYLPGSDVIDAKRCAANYVVAAQQVIANGYMGFRGVGDVTSVARTPQQRAALTTLEYLVDQKMAVQPFSTMCAYNTSRLGSAADELTCLHPFVGEQTPTFRLYAQPGADFALTGEIDAASDETFTTALRRTWPLNIDNTLIIDAQGLEFITHKQLNTLDQRARADGRKVVLRTVQPIPTRLAGLLELTNVRVEPHVDNSGSAREAMAPAEPDS